MPNPYLIENRLQDVTALIQMLGLHTERYSTTTAVLAQPDELGAPRSANTANWLEVARQHPEFFRIGGAEQIYLPSRFLDRPDRPQRKTEDVNLLIKIAVDISDKAFQFQAQQVERELRRQERRNVLIAALIAGFSAILANLLTSFIKPK